MNRQVGLGVLFKLIKSKGRIGFMGIIFSFLSIFVFIPLLVALPSALKEPYEKYDFTEIKQNGIEQNAKVTSVNSINNVTINEKHPEIISYKYENNGGEILDKFKTMDSDKIANIKIGDNIRILVYKNQSMPKNMEPFSFPVYLFYLIPIVFLIVGLSFSLIGVIPALKTFNLYKTGMVREAYITSINLSGGNFLFPGSQQNILVGYYFMDDFNNKVYGESKTTDFLILSGKKAEDKIKIFVSEKDERKSCLIPTLEATKYNWNI